MSTRFILRAVVCALASAATLSSMPVLFGSPRPMIHIRWGDMSDSDRRALEQQFALTEPTRRENDVWAYVPSETSRSRLGEIVTHPMVVSTTGIDRYAFRISDSPPLSARRGGLVAWAPAWLARAAKALAYLLAGVSVLFFVSAVLVSPWIPATSPMRAAVMAFSTDPAVTLRALPGHGWTWMQRRVPIASAEAAGLFRIIFGTAVVGFVASEPVDPAILESFEVEAAQGPYGATLRWLRAHPAVAPELGTWLTVSGVLFILGLCTPMSFACFVVAFLLWACIFTVGTSTHAVAVLGITLIALLAAPWGDRWSLDAWLRRTWRLDRVLLPGPRYGFTFWVPRLVIGGGFLAAAWSKVGGGLDWILNGTVKYHFITDLDHAWVSWGPALTQYHWVAVALSASAVLVEALLITAAFSRSDAYRLMLAAAALSLLIGFALFQGVLWWSWWILLIAFLPWQRVPGLLRRARGVASSVAETTPSFSIAQAAVVVALLVQQAVTSAFHLEARPLFSAYDMYSATYASADDYENATNLVYRVVVVEAGTSRDLPNCVVDHRSAALLPAAAAGAPRERARIRSLLAPCLRAAPSITAVALEGDRQVYNWQERRFEWKRTVDVIGPVTADWLLHE